jgi:tight adherence protein B
LVDFPFLIENLRSCLKAGINIGPAIELLASNPLWSPLLRNPLCKASQCRATGMSLKDSLTTAQKTVGSTGGERYVRQLFSSIILGQASGGDLLGLIKKVQEKSVTAIQLQRRANVLTAQMRFQSLVITLAPLAIGVTIYLFDPNRILFFFKDSRGQFLLVLMITFNIVGAKILNKISKVA